MKNNLAPNKKINFIFFIQECVRCATNKNEKYILKAIYQDIILKILECKARKEASCRILNPGSYTRQQKGVFTKLCQFNKLTQVEVREYFGQLTCYLLRSYGVLVTQIKTEACKATKTNV